MLDLPQLPQWTKTNNYYNREVVTCDVYSKKLANGRGVIYLQDSEHFIYTFSCGASNAYSFTGCFYNTTVKTIEQAQEYLDKFAPLHFMYTRQEELRTLKQSIEIPLF